MPARLDLPPCQENPTHPNHLPSPDKPLRVQVLGLNKTIHKLFPKNTKTPSQDLHVTSAAQFDETGLQLARMAFRLLYGRDTNPGNPSDFIPRHQYNTFHGKHGECEPWEHTVDGYGITFDHLLSDADRDDPETLMLNIYDSSDSEAAKYSKVDFDQYNVGTEAVVLLVPRCCQLRRGTTDRKGINDQVRETEKLYGRKL